MIERKKIRNIPSRIDGRLFSCRITDHMSLGGLGDSFYEYLLKAWIQSGKEDVEARQMYDEAIAAIDQHMIKTSQGKLLYVSDLKYDRLEHKMGHLACFAGKFWNKLLFLRLSWYLFKKKNRIFTKLACLSPGGMFALGAKTQENELSERYMTIAAGLTNTCHESYDRSYTKLGPEAFHFIEGNEAKSLKNGEKYYILRPEVSSIHTDLNQRTCLSIKSYISK